MPSHRLKPIESLVNQLIQSSPERIDALKPLIGQTILIRIENKNIEIVLHIIEVDHLPALTIELNKAASEQEQATVIYGDLQDWLKLAITRDINLPGLKIAGNIHTAQTLKQLFADSELDWASLLSPYLSEEATHLTVKIGKLFYKRARKMDERMTGQVNRYLTRELMATPSAEEWSNFIHNVQQVRQETERLCARVVQIKHKVG